MSEPIQNQKPKIKNPPRPTWAEIDLTASEYNIRRICEMVGPKVKVLSMVKAEAYGHGLKAIAQTAEKAGTSIMGFASLSEALLLEPRDVSIPKLVVGWTPGWLAESARSNTRSLAW